MPKSKPPNAKHRQVGSSQLPPSRGPGALALLLFWPFYLFGLIIRSFNLPLKFLVRAIGYPFVAGVYALAFLSVVYGLRARKFDLTKIRAMPERSIIHDRLGEEIGRIHGEKRSIVPLQQVGENFRKAILAREDERFYEHGAVDIVGIARAILKNLQHKKEGASTITQQLASDIFQLKHGEERGDTFRQLDRKFLEIAIAFRLEAALGKDEIFEAYINQINWGRQIKGIGEASRIYFEKHPSELTLSQAALLAGIVRGPDAFNPFNSLEAATRERGTTLDRMASAGIITLAEAATAKADPVEVRPKWRRENQESYALDQIRRDLEIILEQENIELGGLDITTTIDLRIQRNGEEALEKRLREIERVSGYPHPTRSAWLELPESKRKDPEYIQGAAAVVENRTGAVLAVIGGRDASESRFNRATQARRQIGSLFKPFVYLSAFDKGMSPDSAISDGPIESGEIKGGGSWRPSNSDGSFGGMQPVSYGLIRSRNTMSVRVGNYAGIPRVKEVARMAGFTTPMPAIPSSFLGSWEASPWEVATAYTIFPNEGIRYRPYLISEIKDREGKILYTTPQLSYPAAKGSSAAAVSRILEEVATHGTAVSVTRLGFDKPCAGKTGTTDDFKDAWFSGYTSNLTCAVWVGFDTPRKIVQGGYGAALSLPVWVDIMKTANRLGYKAGKLNHKADLIDISLCRLSGKRTTEACIAAGTSYVDGVPADTVLSENDFCPLHPARAQPVEDPTTPSASPLSPPPRALPVEEAPLRAIPVE